MGEKDEEECDDMDSLTESKNLGYEGSNNRPDLMSTSILGETQRFIAYVCRAGNVACNYLVRRIRT
jgi:lipopolysaccharide biosynthesis protein